jgi:tetratricopeptide (TPR) repeat protein
MDNNNIEDDILIQKYETLLYNKESIYFDLDEFEIIILHYISAERFADALEAIIHAELCYPEDVEIALHKIYIMMQLDNFERAFELLTILEEKEPDLFEINLYKGHIYSIDDDLENALREFELAFEKSPSIDIEGLQYVPEILIRRQHFEEALVFLHKFIDSDNADAQIFFNAGYCYGQTGNIEEAEKYYEKSLDEDPFNEKTWVVLGSLYLDSNNLNKALEAFEFALSINKDNHLAAFCKIATYIKSNNRIKALNCMFETLLKTTDDTFASYSIDESHIKEEDFDESDSCDDLDTEETDQEPDTNTSYWDYSKMLYAQGNIKSAIKIIDKAIKLEPDNEDYLYFRGQCFIRLYQEQNMMSTMLQKLSETEESSSDELENSEFMNLHKKAVFFYNVGDMEECCKYLLESIAIDRKGLDMFYELFPKAIHDAYIINYFGKHLK